MGIEGENVVFSCSVEGNPQPSVKWTKNNETLNVEADSDLNTTSSGNTHNLTIQNVHRSGEGEFRCVASNSIGNTTSNEGTLSVHCEYFDQDGKCLTWSTCCFNTAHQTLPTVLIPTGHFFFYIRPFSLLLSFLCI